MLQDCSLSNVCFNINSSYTGENCTFSTFCTRTLFFYFRNSISKQPVEFDFGWSQTWFSRNPEYFAILTPCEKFFRTLWTVGIKLEIGRFLEFLHQARRMTGGMQVNVDNGSTRKMTSVAIDVLKDTLEMILLYQTP